jgi:hypothetical protein
VRKRLKEKLRAAQLDSEQVRQLYTSENVSKKQSYVSPVRLHIAGRGSLATPEQDPAAEDAAEMRAIVVRVRPVRRVVSNWQLEEATTSSRPGKMHFARNWFTCCSPASRYIAPSIASKVSASILLHCSLGCDEDPTAGASRCGSSPCRMK